MIYYINNSKDPFFNLALEEVLINESSLSGKQVLLLWQNENTIVVGRNQNTLEEINTDYVAKHNVKVVRRPSGGGAVYHDSGNLNFSFIFPKTKETIRNYEMFTKPIITVLKKLGLPAEFSGKNDILIDGKKISGNAQYMTPERVLHHGTILFDVDMTLLPLVLKPNLLKLESKGIKSIRSRVTNIKPLLKESITIEQFKSLILDELQKEEPTEIKSLPEYIVAKTKELAKKYASWEWVYGASPAFNFENKVLIEGKGTIDIRLEIEAGKIIAAKIYGDFLGFNGTEALENKLIGQKYDEENLSNIISETDIQTTFGENFNKAEIIPIFLK